VAVAEGLHDETGDAEPAKVRVSVEGEQLDRSLETMLGDQRHRRG
jgi:hypothetical protein